MGQFPIACLSIAWGILWRRVERTNCRHIVQRYERQSTGRWTSKVIQEDACPRILISALPLIDSANVLTPLLRIMPRTSLLRRQRRPRSRSANVRWYANRCGRHYCFHSKCHTRARNVRVVFNEEIILARYHENGSNCILSRM